MNIEEALSIVLDLAIGSNNDFESLNDKQKEALDQVDMLKIDLVINKIKKVVSFPFDHLNPKHSQVFIALTGEPEAIRSRLNEIVNQFSEYGKPVQGTFCEYQCNSTVITPVWDGKEY